MRRHLGDRVYDTVIPRNVRLSEAPSHGLPIHLLRPGVDAARTHIAALAAELRAPRRRDRGSRRSTARDAAWRCRHDRPHRASARASGAASPRSSRSARRRRSRLDRDPARADPPEPAPAAHAVRRRGARDARREHRRARRDPADPRHRDDRRLPARRRRAARPRGARRPASNASRRSSASSPTASSSSSRSSRTSSARISIRSRRPTPTASSSRSSGSRQEDLATRVGRARSTVANTLRLLDLAPGVQAAVADGRAHRGPRRARSAASPTELQDRVARLGRRPGAVRPPDRGARPAPARADARAGRRRRRAAADPELERVEEDLRRSLGTKVSLARSRRGGRIVIEYYSDEELGRLYERLTGGTA